MIAERTIDWSKAWREEGLRAGREEGRLEGRQEGLREVVMRQLERKFGLLDETIRRRVREADDETLLGWADRTLTADRLKDVFS